MPIQALLSALLAALAVGGFGLAFVYPLLSGERQAEKRRRHSRPRRKATGKANRRRGHGMNKSPTASRRSSGATHASVSAWKPRSAAPASDLQSVFSSTRRSAALFSHSVLRPHRQALSRRRGWPRRRGRSADMGNRLAREKASEEIRQSVSGHDRRYRARREGGPAARRLPAHYRERGRRAGP